MFWTNIISFILGIPSGIIGNYYSDKLKSMHARRSQKVDIEGTWGEFVPDSKGRQFSLGRIYRDESKGIFAFDGTNYSNNGEPYCHWVTVSSHLDLANQQYFYIFRASVESEPDRSYYGFGVVHLTKDERGWFVPANGYYVSASVDGRGMAHSMFKTNDLRYTRKIDGKEAIAFIRRRARAHGTTS